MATMTESSVINAEIERITPVVSTMYERDNTFFSQVEKRPVEVVNGRDLRIVLDLRPGGKTRQWNSDGGDMGRGGGPVYDKAVINTVDLEHAIEWTTRSQWVTDDARKAVVNNFRDLLAKSMAMFRSNTDKIISCGDGNGTLGTVGTWTQNSPAGYDTYVMNSDGFRAHLIRYGCDIAVWASTYLTQRTGTQQAPTAQNEAAVTYLSIPTYTFQVATGQINGVQAGDKVIVSGASATTPPMSLFGVYYHHNASTVGTWLGFNRATTPEVVANSVNAANQPLAHPQPRLAMNLIGDRLGIETRSKKLQAWTHPAQASAYEEMGYGLVQIVKSAKEEPLDLYFSDAMKLAGSPLKLSYNWDRTRIDFVDLDVWGRAELHKPGFYEVDKNKIFPLYGTSGGLLASRIFYLVSSFNCFVKNPAACSYIYALAIPSGY